MAALPYGIPCPCFRLEAKLYQAGTVFRGEHAPPPGRGQGRRLALVDADMLCSHHLPRPHSRSTFGWPVRRQLASCADSPAPTFPDDDTSTPGSGHRAPCDRRRYPGRRVRTSRAARLQPRLADHARRVSRSVALRRLLPQLLEPGFRARRLQARTATVDSVGCARLEPSAAVARRVRASRGLSLRDDARRVHRRPPA